MRIAHIIFSLNIGGAETMLVDIVNEQVKSEQVSLLILNDQYNSTLVSRIDQSVNIVFIGRPEGSRNPWFIAKLNFILFNLSPDVVHCHNHNAIRLVWFKLNTVFTAHTSGIPVNNLSRYNKIFAISKSVKNDLVSRGASGEIVVVYNGIHCGLIQPKENYSVSLFRIIQIGRLDHNIKGQDILLKALHSLVYRHGIKDISVDFIGEGTSYNYLKQLVNDYKIENHVHFLGLKDRDYIYKHLKDYNLLVQPSLIEGFGLTIAEAMAAKVPVLVSDIDGPMELIDNGKYGIYFKSGSFVSCANSIKEIIGNYQSKILKAQLAYGYCINTFGVSSTAEKYLTFN